MLLILCSFCASGQVKQYVLNGQIHIRNGKTYPYQIAFSVKGSSIHGTAITKLTDGTEPRTSIAGTINKKQRTLTFAENTFGNGQKSPITCFADATLAYKLYGTKYMLKGDFKAHDYDFMYCAEGNIEFDDPKTLNSLFGADTTTGTSQSAVKQDPAKQKQKQDNTHTTSQVQTDQRTEQESEMETSVVSEQESVYEITAGVVKQFEWRTDTCRIELYDGGVIDGDEITLVVNDVEILPRYTLTKKKKIMNIPLSKKVNTISIIADREGKIPPNTADINLYDGTTRYRIKAYNNIGESAQIKIYTAK